MNKVSIKIKKRQKTVTTLKKRLTEKHQEKEKNKWQKKRSTEVNKKIIKGKLIEVH